MRTKALILSAMVCVAGALPSFAQNVYSVNVVGYINLTLTNTFTLIANQLDDGEGNLVTNIFKNTLPGNTTLYKFDGSTYVPLTYRGPNNWVPILNRQMLMRPGEAMLVFKPAAAGQIDMTFVGEVRQGPASDPLVNPIVAGFGAYSSIVPQRGRVVTDLALPVAINDIVYRYSEPDGGFIPRTWRGTRWVPINTEPEVEVGEGFFMFAQAGTNWTRVFEVSEP